MKNSMKNKVMVLIMAVCLCAAMFAGCGSAPAAGASAAAESVPETFGSEPVAEAPVEEQAVEEAVAAEAPVILSDAESAVEEITAEPDAAEASGAEPEEAASAEEIVTTLNCYENGILSGTELFTDRDLTQTPDLSGAERYEVADGEDIHITKEGVYVLSGSAANVTVYVEADDQAKVQIVLDGVTITNDDFPCIYAIEADKLFVTTTDTDNSLSVTGTFTADGDTNTDGVIFSRCDLVLNGLGSLTVSSTDNGLVCKDDMKITGGTYVIDAGTKCLEANDSIRIADGVFTLNAGTDALHAENDDDDTLGYIYICGGEFTMDAGDDAIHAVTEVEIDGGTFSITAAEGIEGSYIQINGGTIDIQASDDGINGAMKSSAYWPTVEINGGELTVVMGSGDTDGIDCNGDLYINGGTVSVTGSSTFDYDGTGEYNGGTLIINGQEVDTLPNQMMGGRGH